MNNCAYTVFVTVESDGNPDTARVISIFCNAIVEPLIAIPHGQRQGGSNPEGGRSGWNQAFVFCSLSA